MTANRKYDHQEDHTQDLNAKLSSDITPGLKIIAAVEQRVRNSILDYAIGSAILGLIPIYGHWIPEVRLILLTILNLKMIWNIGRFWGYHQGRGVLAIVSSFLSIIGCLILAILAWLIVFAIGLFIPLIDSLARAVAYGVLTWNIGQTVSRYYYSPQKLDVAALSKALQFQRLNKDR